MEADADGYEKSSLTAGRRLGNLSDGEMHQATKNAEQSTMSTSRKSLSNTEPRRGSSKRRRTAESPARCSNQGAEEKTPSLGQQHMSKDDCQVSNPKRPDYVRTGSATMPSAAGAESSLVASTPLTGSTVAGTGPTAKVFGAGSSFSGFRPSTSLSSAASPSPPGFASLMDANGGGLSSSSGFSTPNIGAAATAFAAPSHGNSVSGYTFGLFVKSQGAHCAPSNPSQGSCSSRALVNLPERVELTTGEEDETNLLAVRCKSYKWVIEEGKTDGEPATPHEIHSKHHDGSESTKTQRKLETNNASHPSVPPSANFDDGAATACGSSSSPIFPSSGHRWQELGIGPLKVLQKVRSPDSNAPHSGADSGSTCLVSGNRSPDVGSTTTRLVQRRESAPNGPATKVILNVPLWKESTLARSSERYVSLTTLSESGQGETFLFKFKAPADANVFIAKLTDVVAVTKSCVKGSRWL